MSTKIVLKLLLSSILFFCCFTLSGQWTEQTSSTSETLYDTHFINDSTGWVTGDKGTVLHTTNEGTSWQKQQVGTNTWFSSIFFVNDSTGWIAGGNQSTVMHTSDSGKTWSAQNTSTIKDLRTIYFIDESTGWAAGNGGTILHTTDGGSTWHEQSLDTSASFLSIYFSDASNGVICGSNGVILITSNGGSSWNYQSIGTSVTLNALSFINASTGWISGSDGTILYTSDGGTTWEFRSPEGVSSVIESVDFVNASTGWIADWSGNIFFTRNGGENWQEQPSPSSEWLRSVHFPSDSTGFIAGGEGTILHSDCPFSNTGDTSVTSCFRYTVPGTNKTYTSGGTYTYTLANEAGCDSVITLDLTIKTADTAVQKNTHSLEAKNHFVSYQWLNCDNNYSLISGDTNHSFQPEKSGNYAVEITQDGCTDTSSCYNITTPETGIISNDFGNNLKVSPNPVALNLNIALGKKYRKIQVRLFNSTGHQVKHRTLNNTGNIKLTLKNKPGLYFLTVQSASGKRAQVRIIKK